MPQPVDHDALHRILWRRTNRKGIFVYRNSDLAEMLGVVENSVRFHLRRLEGEGRIRRVRQTNQNSLGRMVVRNPYDRSTWVPKVPNAQNRRGSPAVPVREREASPPQAKGDGASSAATESSSLAS